MKEFTKGVVFVLTMAGVYKLGVWKGRRTNTKIIVEMDDELKEILEKLEKKLNKKGS